MEKILRPLIKLPKAMGKVADVVNNIIDHIKTSVKVVTLTQEEYDNLTIKDKTTLYIISDAN